MINKQSISLPIDTTSKNFDIDKVELQKLKDKGLIPRNGKMLGFVEEEEFESTFKLVMSENGFDYQVINKETKELFEKVYRVYISDKDITNVCEGKFNLYEIPKEQIENALLKKKYLNEKSSIKNHKNGILKEGVVRIEELNPVVFSACIAIPISCEVINTDKYGGDARSFGYPVDDGNVTSINYSIEYGALVEDTIAMLKESDAIKEKMNKPTHHILEITEEAEYSIKDGAELIIRYDSEYFYKDEKGYFFCTEYYCYGQPQRVTDDSAEIYREVNKEYQRQIVEYNKIRKEALANLKLITESLARV